MAQNSGGGVGDILKWGLLLGGGYWLYNQFVSAPAAAAAAAPSPSAAAGSAPTPGTSASSESTYPAWMTSLAALASQLQTMAGSPTQSIDQWVYYYNQLRQQRNMAELTGAQVTSILNVSPATQAVRTTPIAAQDFVNDIFGLGLGLSGVNSGARRIQLPALFIRSW